MSTTSEDSTTGEAVPAARPYDIVLLTERGLADADARMLAELYAEVEQDTHLYVLLPVQDTWAMEDAAGRPLLFGTDVEAWSMPDLGAGVYERDQEQLAEAEQDAAEALGHTLALLRAHGFVADGETVPHEPLATLRAVVRRRHSREVVILTRRHPISEMLRTDWTSHARRHLEVPVLHLLEHASG